MYADYIALSTFIVMTITPPLSETLTVSLYTLQGTAEGTVTIPFLFLLCFIIDMIVLI